MLIVINSVRTFRQCNNCDNYKVLTKIKQATAFSTNIFYFIATKVGANCVAKYSCLKLFNTLILLNCQSGKLSRKITCSRRSQLASKKRAGINFDPSNASTVCGSMVLGKCWQLDLRNKRYLCYV